MCNEKLTTTEITLGLLMFPVAIVIIIMLCTLVLHLQPHTQETLGQENYLEATL